MTETQTDLTIRRLGTGDGEALARLAQRDTSPIPSGTVIAAFAPGGALVAAISLETGALVADPFLPSEHATALLRVRAEQIGANSGAPTARFRLRRRRARAALPASPPGAGGRLLALTGLRPPS